MKWAAILPFALSAFAQPPAVTGTPVEQATLRYIEIQPGAGNIAKPGQEYTVHYTGWLRDGTQFDSSSGRDPLKFVQGRREVIPGFDAGFEGMKVGGKRRIIIPYQLAYGDQARGKIPSKSELTFDVELLAVTDPPALAAASDLLQPFNEMEKQILALADAIPEDKYSWRPAPGVRSVQEVLLHIAYGNQLLLNIANNQPKGDALDKQIDTNAKAESQKIAKAEVIKLVAGTFAEVRAALEGERSTGLGRNAEFFGTPTTRRGILTRLDVHVAEHLGQLIAYARVNGIVPPWSK